MSEGKKKQAKEVIEKLANDLSEYYVYRPEHHICKVAVSAKSKEDALQRVRMGEGTEIHTEFIEPIHEYSWEVDKVK